jgi:hypothetical protein
MARRRKLRERETLLAVDMTMAIADEIKRLFTELPAKSASPFR